MSSNYNTPLSDVTYSSSSEVNKRKTIEPGSLAKIKYFPKNLENSYICSLCFKELKSYYN